MTDPIDPARACRSVDIDTQFEATIASVRDAFIRGDSDAVQQYIEDHPDSVAVLGRMTDHQLSLELFASSDILRSTELNARAVDAVKDGLAAVVRDAVRQQVTNRIDGELYKMNGLLNLSNNELERACQRRGTRNRDANELRQQIANYNARLADLRNFVQGREWELEDFPGARQDILCSFGAAHTPIDSIIHDSFRSTYREFVDFGTELVATYHRYHTVALVVETGLGFAAGGPPGALAVLAAESASTTATSLGHSVTEGIVQTREERKRLGEHLGM